jgi:hypothetical protein
MGNYFLTFDHFYTLLFHAILRVKNNKKYRPIVAVYNLVQEQSSCQIYV